MPARPELGRHARICADFHCQEAFIMDTQEQIAVIVHTISHQGGRIDALNSTLLSMLHLVKGSPGLREAIEAQLEQNYSSLLARSENPQYVAGFESVRDMIVGALK